MLNKILSVIISVLIVFSGFSLNVFAESSDSSASSETTSQAPKGDFIVSADTVSGNVGNSVLVKLRVKNNPGVMAMTISITYDSSSLRYRGYYVGKVFSDYTVKAHPDRNIIRLVISEEHDVYGDGAIVGFIFRIADNAEAKLHEVSVEYSSGDFCNNNLERLMPKIEPGGIEVAYNGTNCGHRKFTEWIENMPPTCTDNGVEQHECTLCGHVELRETEPTGHDFSDKWTVDVPATEDTPGVMSRHCKNCNFTTDETNFTLEQSDKGNIDNNKDTIVPDNEVIKDIIIQQHPDINPSSPNSTPSGSEDKTSSSETSSTESSKPTESTSDTSKDTASSENIDSSEKGSSSETTTSKNETSTDTNTTGNLKEQDTTQEQIKDIIEIISPDKSEEDAADTAVNVTQKLREVFPKIDEMVKIFKTSIIILLILIFL